MAESIVEQIIEALKGELEAIAGDHGTTYWYTPRKVARVEHFMEPPTGYGDVVYMIRDTPEERVDLDSEFGESRRILDVFVQLCRKDDRGNVDPFSATTAKGTLRERMIQDVSAKLEGDFTRGGLAFSTEIAAIDRELETRTSWVVAEMLLEVTYDHALGSP